jgi:hypothetical protein
MEPAKFQVVFFSIPNIRAMAPTCRNCGECMSQGKTLEEATTNIQDAISGYLTVLAKH